MEIVPIKFPNPCARNQTDFIHREKKCDAKLSRLHLPIAPGFYPHYPVVCQVRLVSRCASFRSCQNSKALPKHSWGN